MSQNSPLDLRETVIGSESIFRGRVVKVRVDTVNLPDGRETRREVVEHPGAVGVVALDGADVLLVRQYRHPAGEALLEIPAGTLEPAESPQRCAARELVEETGFAAGRLQPLGGIFLAPGYSSERLHLFLATELTPAQAEPDADEFLQLVRVPLDEAVQMAAAADLHDAKTVAGLLMVAARRW